VGYKNDLTDDNGGFEFTVPVSSVARTWNLNVRAAGPAGAIFPEDVGVPYVQTFSTITIPANSSADVNVGNIIAPAGVKNDAFEVFDAIVTGFRYHRDLLLRANEGDTPTDVEVIYPSTTVGNSQLKRFGDDILIVNADSENWDIILEEYGHFVQHVYGLEGDQPPDTSHEPAVNMRLRDGNGNLISTDLTLAWDEGWGQYFSQIAQREQNARSLNIGGTIDDGNALFGSIDVLPNQVRRGEDGEASVAAVLWDVYRGRSPEYGIG
jgi:hypothetical protein